MFCLLLPDMGHCEITRGRQALELRSNLSERRSLTDHIQTSDHCSVSYSARNLQWAVAHGTLFTNFSLTKYLKAYCQDWRLLDLMLASNPNTLFLKNTLFKCLSLQFYQRVFACSLTVAWRCSLGLPQSSPTSWSSTLGYWRSPKK